MKILFILPEYYPHSGGGISTYYKEYIQALAPHVKKIKVIVGSGFTQGNDVYLQDCVEIEYLKENLFQKYILKFSHFDFIPEFKQNIAAAWAIYEQADCGKGYDFVECVDFGLGFVPWTINHIVPVIIRLHGSSGQIDLKEPNLDQKIIGDCYRQIELLLLPLSDYIITHSKANQSFWKNQLPNCEINLIYPIYEKILQNSTLKRNNDGIITARVQKWKGPEILCKALTALKDFNHYIYWYGKDTPYDNHISTVEYLLRFFPEIWQKQIIKKEALINSEILIKQQESKFGLVTSTWDMFNFTCIEFLANGVLVIASNGAGASEIIEDNINGFIYDALDHHSLAACIKKVYMLSDEEYENITSKGKTLVKEKLSGAKLIPENIEAYRKASFNFKKDKSIDFLASIFSPSENRDYLSVMLNKLSLKQLVNYFYKRFKKKISNLFC